MALFMKVKLKMASDMVAAPIKSMMQPMKESGKKGKKKEKEKSSSKAEVFLKDNSKMISSMDLVKCIIILLATTLKVIGKTTSKKEKVR